MRQTQEFQVELVNSTPNSLDYEISIDGNYLSGSDVFSLKPLSSGRYSIFYSPLQEGRSKGSLQIFNRTQGAI